MKRNKLIEFFLIVVIIITTISYVPKQFQNDTFFTIAIGERIRKFGIEENEMLTWHKELKYTNSRWLFDAIVSIWYDYFDFFGVNIFVIICSISIILLYCFILYKLTGKLILSVFFTLIFLPNISCIFAGRAMIISFFIFLLEFYCLEQITSKECKKMHIFFLIILPIILANVHASTYPMYFIIMLPYFAEWIFYKIFAKYNLDSKIKVEKIKNIILIFDLLLISVLAAFCTPPSVAPFSDMIKVMSGKSSSFIGELQPMNLLSELKITFTIITVIAILGFSDMKIKLSDALFILGFFFLSINTRRCEPFFYLISTICAIKLLSDFIDYNNLKITINNKYVWSIFIISLIFITNNSISKILYNMSSDYIALESYPVDATEYILNNVDIDNMRIYNHFNFGSYLEFKGIPVFIDSRSRYIYTRI